VKRGFYEEGEQLNEVVDALQRMIDAEKNDNIDIPVVKPGMDGRENVSVC
jgi:hypothetical protein